MSEDKEKALEKRNNEKISEMILNFRQCADATSELSNSIGKFTEIYKSVAQNVAQLKEMEINLNSNEDIKKLLHITGNMKEIFDYFNLNIPQLSKDMEASKEELDSYKEEVKNVADYFQDLPTRMNSEVEIIKEILKEQFLNNKNTLDELKGYLEVENKKMEEQHSKMKKKISTDIKKHIDHALVDFKEQGLKLVNDGAEKIISEKTQGMLKEFEDMINVAIETIVINQFSNDIDTIYNLYVNNGRKLPISVRKSTWSRNFYFEVERIEQRTFNGEFSLIAYGKRYRNGVYYDICQESADSKQFENYIKYTYTNITPIDDGDIPF